MKFFGCLFWLVGVGLILALCGVAVWLLWGGPAEFLQSFSAGDFAPGHVTVFEGLLATFALALAGLLGLAVVFR